ncbi:uncharacterized protein LOC120682195 isoform X2 [Panicum virgatum]|uniref:uncharacterized protein LOC120672686 isoform X2 n=1 Tax=Panicum virgatum TaxID=38727 RepID=UPI0019D54062|nr:uncharacterized protein LOC120672686 isoform X2 [Panicum virgatum]XP_039819924.1 uncharacterized protein LOC120682195 isoform X2 [Panicum virgatum]
MAVWRCFISQTHGWISSGLEEGSRSPFAAGSKLSGGYHTEQYALAQFQIGAESPCLQSPSGKVQISRECDYLPVSTATSNLFPCVGWRHPSTWGFIVALQWPYFVLVAPSITIPVEEAGSYGNETWGNTK